VEHLVPLIQVPALLPAINGRRPSHCTVWRWVTHGIQGQRLKALRVGHNWFVDPPDIEDFGMRLAVATIQKLNVPTVTTSKPEATKRPTRSTKDREKAIQQAEAQLARGGV
jgi:hypothetical protein